MIQAADKRRPFRGRLATTDGLPPPAAALLFTVAALAVIEAAQRSAREGGVVRLGEGERRASSV
jgi:hypothetical protein